MTAATPMTPKQFRAELVKIMPGYKWTIHKTTVTEHLAATGIQSSGFNRLSTLHVVRDERRDEWERYVVRSAGHGTKSPWIFTNKDGTLARALRGLQDYYQSTANQYRSLAASLEKGRSDV